MRRALFALILTLASVVHLSSWANETREPRYEAQVRRIAKTLRCAVCQNQSVYDSNSDLAKDMLGVIREKARSGMRDSEIRQYFFERYGDYIYLEPRKGGLNWILWLTPFVGLLVGGIALQKTIRHWMRRDKKRETPNETPSPAMHQKIQEALDRIEV